MTNVFYSFLNAGAITAIMIFILFMIFGTGGGFSVIYDLGKFASTIPVWFWGVLAGGWIFSKILGK